MKQVNYVLLILSLLSVSPAFSKFLYEDAEYLDSDLEVGTEYYNDLFSYRYPESWIKSWSSTRVGYRANTGSLSMKVLKYHDDLVVDPDDKSEVSLAYRQSRKESVDDVALTREMVVRWRRPSFEFELLGDGDTSKEFADLGATLSFSLFSNMNIGLLYWSTDHFYNEKVREAHAWRYKNGPTTGIWIEFSSNELYSIRLNYDKEHPVKWVRGEKAHIYSREKEAFSLRLEFDGHSYSPFLDIKGTRKSEAFDLYTTNVVSSEPSQSMRRHVTETETGLRFRRGNRTKTMGLFYGERRYKRSENLEGTISEGVRRLWDRGIYLSSHDRFSSDDHFWQWGAQVNYVYLKDDGFVTTTEVKLQLALDLRINDTSRCFINTTWDVDEIHRNAPFNEKPLNPWGGGNVQFQMSL